MNMTIKQLAAIIDREATYTTDNGLRIRVKVIDAKQAYGTMQYLITPLAGEREVWVRNLIIDDEAPTLTVG
jgi:hypothetical protein|tara:strand:+ start:728 stop:940 length:213 start_codon:yes stop_codon:yes gene_type:complete